MFQTFFKKIILISFILAGLAACSGKSRYSRLAYVEKPVETLYLNAKKRLDQSRWDEAAEYFDEVERQHPYSDWARRAMLMSAFSHYQGDEYEKAIESARRFISLHPGNQAAAYAYYLIAMCYYEQIVDVERDQNITQNALSALHQVINRFPDTDYAKDARHKLFMTEDHLAGKDMEIGRWYLKRNQFLAGINRFKYVVDHYSRTSQIEEALHRLIEAYLSLGVFDEARRIGGVSGYNYPDGKWYKKSYALLEKHGLTGDEIPKRHSALSQDKAKNQTKKPETETLKKEAEKK